MELRVLRYFLTVADEGNITRAADILHVTQPTLSRQMMELEDEMGTPLLIRGKRSVTLTDEGFLFRQQAETIVESCGGFSYQCHFSYVFCIILLSLYVIFVMFS